MTITHLLLLHHPQILEIDALWIDALLEAEYDMMDAEGRCSLMFLI